MPVLRYWDVAASAYLPVAQGPVGPAGPAGGFGVPPVAPPASGTNTTTDAAGNVWVSRNGSVWKLATNALHCRVYQTAAYNLATSPATFAFDTVDRDPYAIYALSGAFTIYVTGWYLFSMKLAVNFTAAGQSVTLIWSRSGTVPASTYAGGLVSQQGEGMHVGPTPASIYCNAGDQLIWQGIANPGLAGIPGSNQTFATLDYLGTG